MTHHRHTHLATQYHAWQAKFATQYQAGQTQLNNYSERKWKELVILATNPWCGTRAFSIRQRAGRQHDGWWRKWSSQQQVRQRQLRVLSPPTVHDVFGDERTQSQTLVQLAHQKQTTVGSDARTLEINLQRRVKRALKGLIRFSPTGSRPPQSSLYSQSRMNTGVGAIILTQSSKRKCVFNQASFSSLVCTNKRRPSLAALFLPANC